MLRVRLGAFFIVDLEDMFGGMDDLYGVLRNDCFL